MIATPRMPVSPHSNLDPISTELRNLQDPRCSPPIDSSGEVRTMPAARAPVSGSVGLRLSTAKGGSKPVKDKRGQKIDGADDSENESDDNANRPAGPSNGPDGGPVKKPWWKRALGRVSKGTKKAFRIDSN